MKLEERKRVESIRRLRKTKGKRRKEEEGDGTKTGAMVPTPPSSSSSNHGVLGTCNQRSSSLAKSSYKKTRTNKQKQTNQNKNHDTNHSYLNTDHILRTTT